MLSHFQNGTFSEEFDIICYWIDKAEKTALEVKEEFLFEQSYLSTRMEDHDMALRFFYSKVSANPYLPSTKAFFSIF
jgi:hypothetical protein